MKKRGAHGESLKPGRKPTSAQGNSKSNNTRNNTSKSSKDNKNNNNRNNNNRNSNNNNGKGNNNTGYTQTTLFGGPYQQAGAIVDKLMNNTGSIRSLCFSDQVLNKKAVYALVCETLRYSTVIDKILKAHPLVLNKFPRKRGLCRVLVFKHIIKNFGAPEEQNEKEESKKKRSGGDEKFILQFKTSLHNFLAHLIDQHIRLQQKANPAIVLPRQPIILLPEILQNSIDLPRYARVNLLKTTVPEAIEYFQKKKNYLFVEQSEHVAALTQFRNKNINSDVNSINTEYNEESNDNDSEKNAEHFKLTENTEKNNEQEKKTNKKVEFFIDRHLPDVLVFPAGTDLHADKWVEEGKIFLQDKASCLSASVLMEGVTNAASSDSFSSDHVCDAIDACSAPGNKTTHFGALMGRDRAHSYYAVEKDSKRIELLRQFTEKAGLDVNIIHGSFLDLDTNDVKYQNVSHILVDPSCSGSGIVSRLDSLLESYTGGFTEARKLRLAKFQKEILSHALQFANVQRVVYSTCSIFEEENEQVVGDVLLEFGDRFRLRTPLPTWTHRGLPKYEHAEHCIRASPLLDNTNGFFVACFERISASDDAPVDNDDINNHNEDSDDKRTKKRVMSDNPHAPNPKRQKTSSD